MLANELYLAGSYALHNAVLPRDSTIASKLRMNGLIILGKASMTEWAMSRSGNSSHAWSAVSGQIFGAYCSKQCPGISSGGNGVATDLGLAWAAIGTEVSLHSRYQPFSTVRSLKATPMKTRQ